MFKDTSSGTTHSYNDGCGEPEHNKPEKWEEEFMGRFGVPDTVRREVKILAEKFLEEIKSFIRQATSEAVEEERKRILKIVKKKDVKELFPNVDVTVPDKMLSEAVLKKEGYNIAVDEILSILNCKS